VRFVGAQHPLPPEFCCKSAQVQYIEADVFKGLLPVLPVLFAVTQTHLLTPAPPIRPATIPRSASGVQMAQAVPPAVQGRVVHVDPEVGQVKGDGSEKSPYKTLTRAIQAAPMGSILVLAPGLYTAESGEIFPITLKPGVTLRGDAASRGQDIVLRGSGTFYSPSRNSQAVSLVGVSGSVVTGITVINPNPQGVAIWLESASPIIADSTITGVQSGITVAGVGNATIQNNYIYQNGSTGVELFDAAAPVIDGNIFEKSPIAIALNQQASPTITGNRITQNKDGIVIRDAARPTLQNNFVEGNEQDGIVATANFLPMLDASSMGSAAFGSNTVRNNGRFDVNAPKTSLGKRVSLAPASPEIAPSAPSAAPVSLPVSPPVSPAIRPLGLSSEAAPAIASPASVRTTVTMATAPLAQSRVTQLNRTPPATAPQSATQLQSIPVVQAAIAAPPAGLTNGGFPVPAALAPAASSAPIVAMPIAAPIKPAPNRQVLPPPIITPVETVAPPPARTIPAPQPDIAPPPAVPAINLRSLQPLPRPVAAAPRPASLAMATPSPAAPNLGIPTAMAPVMIPVPPPETGAVPALAVMLPPQSSVLLRPSESAVAPAPAGSNATASPPRSQLLPVPSPDIPVGNIGDMPSVYVSRIGRSRENARPLNTISSLSALGLRHRVLVLLGNPDQQSRLQAIAPNAFPVSYQGRTLMQVGAFGDRDKAAQLVNLLTSQGLNASLISLE
jgi:parallel beta-helix repeat protein